MTTKKGKEKRKWGDKQWAYLPEKRDLKDDEEKECRRSDGRNRSSPFSGRGHFAYS